MALSAWAALARGGRRQQLPRWPRAAARAAGGAAALGAPARPAQAGEQAVGQPQPAAHAKQQTVDYTALAACCHELSGAWVPSKVEEVVQPDRCTLALRLRTPLAQGWLHLSWHPVAARVCMGQPPPRGDVAEAFSFAAQASAQLKGLVLLRADLPAPWERVARLEFGPRPGEPAARRLFCEIMAKYSNVVGGAMSSLRQVQQGRTYTLPPRVSGVPPSAAEPADAWRDAVTRGAALAAAERGAGGAAQRRGGGGGVGSVLAGATRAYMGVSPALVQELCAAAGVDAAAAPGDLGDAGWAALHGTWLAWLAALEGGAFAPSACPATGRFTVLGLRPLPEVHASAHDMLDGVFRGLQAGELYAALHTRLSAAVRGALKKARGRVRAFEQQLAAADGAAALQRSADIIMANLYRLEPGAAELVAEDWDSGEAVTLALDPDKTPVEQAEATYKRARKLRRAVDAVSPLLGAAQQELEYLETVELELAQMPPGGAEAELAALREVQAPPPPPPAQEELVEARVIRPPPEAALSAKAAAKGRKAARKQAGARAGGGAAGGALAAAAAAAGGAGLRAFVSPGGFTVLVGRNNKQNDVLSHQVAKPGDLWMHVRGLPGSHTVIRREPGQGEPGRDDLQFAADLAAWFSKARVAGKADVIVARAEALKKFKGAKPGQVLVTREEGNVVARPAESAAARGVAGAA
ncbi:rqcH [Scenedesmus sp. PABB004]|nr:rqcH [Scenedesmus sp. PABB004]